MENRPRQMEIGVTGIEGGVIWTAAGERETGGRTVKFDAPADAVTKIRAFIAAPATGAQHEDVGFAVRGLDEGGGMAQDTAFFERPEQAQ
jgi:hypothetical protein